MGRLVYFAAPVVVALVFVSSAAGGDLPTLGTTTTTRCDFDPNPKVDYLPRGVTYCSRQIVTTSGGDCYSTGYRLYFEERFSSARWYQGNAVLPGLDRIYVDGDYSDVVRPNARLIYDSGDHTSGLGFLEPDASCT